VSADRKAAELRAQAALWEKGRDGERRVAEILRGLPEPAWHVLHDLQIGSRGANLDHLVVGPGGVFTINTKNVAGSVWVAERKLLINGNSRSEYLPKAVREAARVAERLTAAVGRPVTVAPTIVFVENRIAIKAMPHDVTVLHAQQLVSWLLARPVSLAFPDVTMIARAASQPMTWKQATG
jgi:hypothetical protein